VYLNKINDICILIISSIIKFVVLKFLYALQSQLFWKKICRQCNTLDAQMKIKIIYIYIFQSFYIIKEFNWYLINYGKFAKNRKSAQFYRQLADMLGNLFWFLAKNHSCDLDLAQKSLFWTILMLKSLHMDIFYYIESFFVVIFSKLLNYLPYMICLPMHLVSFMDFIII